MGIGCTITRRCNLLTTNNSTLGHLSEHCAAQEMDAVSHCERPPVRPTVTPVLAQPEKPRFTHRSTESAEPRARTAQWTNRSGADDRPMSRRGRPRRSRSNQHVDLDVADLSGEGERADRRRTRPSADRSRRALHCRRLKERHWRLARRVPTKETAAVGGTWTRISVRPADGQDGCRNRPTDGPDLERRTGACDRHRARPAKSPTHSRQLLRADATGAKSRSSPRPGVSHLSDLPTHRLQLVHSPPVVRSHFPASSVRRDRLTRTLAADQQSPFVLRTRNECRENANFLILFGNGDK
jgi:hypothetical protein